MRDAGVLPGEAHRPPLFGWAVFAVMCLFAGAAIAVKGPDLIPLPDGFRPEGGAAGQGSSIYVGSIPTGRVLEIDTKTGDWSEAVPAREGHAAIGLKYARREDRLFVSGGPTGKAYVYDADSGAELAAFQLTPEGAATFINDVALTRDTAYFTDSRQPVIYAVARDLSGVTPIPLTGFPMTAGNNLNGIEVSSNGRVLLAIQSSEGVLWRIDPATGSHTPVDLGGATLAAGDGLLLVNSRTLLVVQNRLNQIAVVRLDPRYRSGRVVPPSPTPTSTSRPRSLASAGASTSRTRASRRRRLRRRTTRWSGSVLAETLRAVKRSS